MARGDDYVFQAGDACGHNTIIATIPPGQEYGTGSAAALASQVKKFFPRLWFGLLVGVAAGLPNLSRSPPRDIRLGDVLVGLSEGGSAGLVAYDLGKETETVGFQLLRSGYVLAITETAVRSAIGSIKLNAPNDADVFSQYYKSIAYEEHPHGSGEKLMKNARKRNELRDRYDLIGLEMEAAGTMNRIPVGVIRGVCDYGDAHKNKEWQPYAAAMAAAYAKAVLAELVPKNVLPEPRTMNVRPQGRLDEDDEPLASVTINGRKKRRIEQRSEASGARALPFDNERPISQEVNSSTRDFDNVIQDTSEPLYGAGHFIEAPVKQSIIDQLYFTKIDERLTRIAAAQIKTCRWFLTKPEYKSWHDTAEHPDHGGFLWIKGNPGTGKSTLMKLLFEDTKSNERGDPSRITLSFFFLGRGTVEEKSVTGLYRSLLHQLFQKEPRLRDSLDWMTADGAKVVQRNGWHEETLKQTLAHAVQSLGRRSLTIFIDALDECDQEQVSGMVCCFEELCDRARKAHVRLHICFSSRHYPTVVIQTGIEVTLEDEPGHTEDIKRYIKVRLRLPNPRSSQAESLLSKVLEKSSGIFLWVVLVLDILNSEYAKGSGRIKKMRDRLEEIPPKLNDLFEMILTRDEENLLRLQLCLKWILFAMRPLKPQELYFAIELGCDKECTGYWDEEDVDLDTIKAFVRMCSKGLAEVTRNSRASGLESPATLQAIVTSF
ncbi:NACHT domain-containing protein [Hirsutella rhossiliensis]|uniref:NACHT domain-containing protein n=1 Tax=Hirsutella rhossiliensis TaxID=111463 RepID=A0A9P8SK66_9HYPO|nr:NACHT domain-containing protein [Hirsutella rhossiliensis]KAH0963801.1 NACHT domain-containing protein [Hirsutella rhossiliensis]